jgi:hypothetical protein
MPMCFSTMTHKHLTNILLIILLFTISSFSQPRFLPADTTPHAGASARITGYCMLGVAIALLGLGAYSYYEHTYTVLDSVTSRVYGEYPIYLVGGFCCAFSSGVLLRAGYHRRNEYRKWKKGNYSALSLELAYEF